MRNIFLFFFQLPSYQLQHYRRTGSISISQSRTRGRVREREWLMQRLTHICTKLSHEKFLRIFNNDIFQFLSVNLATVAGTVAFFSLMIFKSMALFAVDLGQIIFCPACENLTYPIFYFFIFRFLRALLPFFRSNTCFVTKFFYSPRENNANLPSFITKK